MKHYCLNCNDGTQLQHLARDLTIVVGALSERLHGVSGWHCPVCGEVEFDSGEGERYASAMRGLCRRLIDSLEDPKKEIT